MRIQRVFAAFAVAVSAAGCGSFMKADKADILLKPSEEFERAVVISEAPEADAPAAAAPAPAPEKKAAKKKTPVKPAKKGKAAPAGPPVHEPDLEDGGNFAGRRPKVDPFRVGETVTLDVHYFKISAVHLRVAPFAQVNGKKAYQFVTELETYPRFSSMVYAVEDKAVTLLDYEELVPRVFTLHVKETNQLREARSYFDFDKLEARYWEKKITEKDGVQEKRLQWEILPFSQNVFSAIFYMRLFPWETGKEYAFRVADDEKNHIFKGTALRREMLDTDIGELKAVVVKAEIVTKGAFAQTGDIMIWLSDDDRKLVLRIESKLKFATLVAEVIQLDPGKAP